MRRPARVRGAWRSRSRSRTELTSSGSLWRGMTRSSSRKVAGPDDAVDGKAHVALEVGQGRGGQVAEDAVDAPGVEAEGRQPALQVGDVVASEHRAARL